MAKEKQKENMTRLLLVSGQSVDVCLDQVQYGMLYRLVFYPEKGGDGPFYGVNALRYNDGEKQTIVLFSQIAAIETLSRKIEAPTAKTNGNETKD